MLFQAGDKHVLSSQYNTRKEPWQIHNLHWQSILTRPPEPKDTEVHSSQTWKLQHGTDFFAMSVPPCFLPHFVALGGWSSGMTWVYFSLSTYLFVSTSMKHWGFSWQISHYAPFRFPPLILSNYISSFTQLIWGCGCPVSYSLWRVEEACWVRFVSPEYLLCKVGWFLEN
jgi:hypothetical protein